MAIVILQQGGSVTDATCQRKRKDTKGQTCEIVTRVIPRDLACSYISPSTSDDTAEVHSSRMAKVGR